jgi:hypothetical protein
MNATLARKN